MNRVLAVATSALLVVASSTVKAADEQLGRLFFSPQQRAALDAGRRIASEKKTVDKRPARREPSEVELNGIVTRSDGERTLWVNGKAYYDGSPRGMRIKTDPRKPASARVQVPSQGTAAELRVGQRLDTRTGVVSDKMTSPPSPPGTAPSASGSRERGRAGAAPRADAEDAATVDDDEKD